MSKQTLNYDEIRDHLKDIEPDLISASKGSKELLGQAIELALEEIKRIKDVLEARSATIRIAEKSLSGFKDAKGNLKRSMHTMNQVAGTSLIHPSVLDVLETYADQLSNEVDKLGEERAHIMRQQNDLANLTDLAEGFDRIITAHDEGAITNQGYLDALDMFICMKVPSNGSKKVSYERLSLIIESSEKNNPFSTIGFFGKNSFWITGYDSGTQIQREHFNNGADDVDTIIHAPGSQEQWRPKDPSGGP